MNIQVDEEVCGESGDQVEDGHDEAELDPVAPVLELDHIGVIDVDEEDDVVEDGEGVHDGGHYGGLGLLRPGDAQEQAQEEHEVHKHEALEIHREMLDIYTYVAVCQYIVSFTSSLLTLPPTARPANMVRTKW